MAPRTLDVAEQLAARGAVCSVASLQPAAIAIERRRVNGVDHTVLPATRRFRVPRRGLGALRELVAQHDVVHLLGHWSPLNVVIARLAEKQGKPYVVCPAGSLRIQGRSTWLKACFNAVVGNRMVKRSSAWIAIVEREIPDFEAYGIERSRIAIIPNAAVLDDDDTNGVAGAGLHDYGPDQLVPDRYVLFLGRLDHIKGPDLLLDAFIRVADVVEFDLAIAGPDRGLLARLEDSASRSGFPHRIRFLGVLGGEHKQRIMRGADALVIPSRSEAMSMVVLEAALCNRPVLATTECGLNDLLSEGAGAVVEPSVEGLANGLLSLQSIDLDVAGVELRSRVEAAYGWDSVAELYRELFAGMMSDDSGAQR